MTNQAYDDVVLSADATAWETSGRSLAKAISYRVVSSLVTGSIFFGATQRVRLAVALALIESIVKIGIFYIHERAWMKIAFGRDNHTGRIQPPSIHYDLTVTLDKFEGALNSELLYADEW